MRRRGEPDEGAAHLTAAEAKKEARRAQLVRQRKLIRRGKVLMCVGGLMAIVHLLTHFDLFGRQPSGVVDLTVGYPMAMIIFAGGAILAGQ
ncbi:MAG TPA: hypothetical protein VG818_05425 [Gemmatimonadaceae bacterium]|nr:hypothetical protein [Gemmatimonadaceae bacterium]